MVLIMNKNKSDLVFDKFFLGIVAHKIDIVLVNKEAEKRENK